MVRSRLWVALALLIAVCGIRAHGQSTGGPLAFSGHAFGESVTGAVPDGSGGIWIVGYESLTAAPAASADAFQPNSAGNSDGYLEHIGADGSPLYVTYLGGSGGDFPAAIARDPAGNLYVVGETTSSDFPTTAGAYQPVAPGAGTNTVNAFVSKFDPTGKHLLYSTYLGGTSSDGATGVAIDASGNAHVVGFTQGFGFPYTWDRCLNYTTSQQSSFYTKLSADGKTVLFSTCLDDSTAAGITLDANGDAWIVGMAERQFGPIMNGVKSSFPANASSQGYLAKFTPENSDPLPISTLIGGSDSDWANAVAVTSKGVYIAGTGYSTDYPGAPTRQTHPQTFTLDDGRTVTETDSTAWIMKVRPDGQAVLGTTLIDGNGMNDVATSLQVGSDEVVYVSGSTDSTDLPTSADAPQRTNGGRVDMWYATAWMPNNVVGDPQYLTYYGGADDERGKSLVFDGNGGAWITGTTSNSSTSQGFYARYGQPVGSGGSGSDIVMYVEDATTIVGNWDQVSDSTAAGTWRMWNSDQGMPKITTASAAPANYFELTFNAQAGVGYHLWLRMKADNDSYQNDSVFVQFSDSVDGSGNPIWRTGRTSATVVSLEDCGGCGEQGWGWNDNGYGTAGTPVIFATSGPHTIRIQQREDGISIDQIVLSSATWATTAPGANKNDTTILQASRPGNVPPQVALTSPADGATYVAPATISIRGGGADNDGTITRIDVYENGTLLTTTSSSFSYDWTNVPVGTYTITAVATDNDGATTTSKAVTVTVSDHVSTGALPQGWTDADVGDTGAAGHGAYDANTGTFTVQGAGADVWGTEDAFNYVYMPVSGDGQISARVVTLSGEANWVKAGVMIRGSLSPSSAQAFSLVSYAKSAAFQRRLSDGNTTVSTSFGSGAAPFWVKLVRFDGRINAYVSDDGVTWFSVGTTDTFTMGADVYVGLAVSSHVAGTLATATFDHVSVSGFSAPTGNPPPPSGQCSSVTVSQTSFYSGGPASTWEINVTVPNDTCTWTASIDQSWLVLNTIAGPTTVYGTGSTKLTLQTLDNRTGAYRYGTFTIAGRTYKVTQEPF